MKRYVTFIIDSIIKISHIYNKQTQYYKDIDAPKFNAILIKIPRDFPVEHDKIILKFS